jgi:hypothetical protein
MSASFGGERPLTEDVVVHAPGGTVRRKLGHIKAVLESPLVFTPGGKEG